MPFLINDISLCPVNKIVGLYFSMTLFEECESFTQKLIEMYDKLKSQGENFEIGMIPLDDEPLKKGFAIMRLVFTSLDRQDLDEDEEDEENDGSALAAQTKRTTDVQSTAGSRMLHEAPPRAEGIPEKDSGGVPELSEIEDVSHRSQQMGDMSEGPPLESLRTEENAPSDSFGAATIEDSPTFPTFSAWVIREAQALGALDLDKPHDGEDPFCDLFTGIEDVASISDESSLFHGVQQALNQAAAVHREACSWSQNKLRRYEADLQRVTDERNSLKLLLGKREEEIKDLQAELANRGGRSTEAEFAEKAKGWPDKIHEHELCLLSVCLTIVMDAVSQVGYASFYSDECDFLEPKGNKMDPEEAKDEQEPKEGWVCDGEICLKG
ncbi:probable nucleoredoxin 1 [Nicotiana tomentosiformis]|uniref:probable nucleoredoxin 1 n=1 Tax=Nicotiana tomentosiformis TaxID=4098 RepID=UPI00388CB10F